MNRFARLGFLLLPLALSGCFHRRNAPPLPPQAQAPVIPSQQPPASTPPQTPPQQIPSEVSTGPQAPKPEPPKQQTKPKSATHAKRPKTTTPKPSGESSSPSTSAAAPAAKPSQQASLEGVPMGSPIGQLTSGASDNSAQRHKEALQLIDSTEQGVSRIHRSLSNKEKETVTQIRVFLKQAKDALGSEDIDGAMNLGNKAKVLLEELTK